MNLGLRRAQPTKGTIFSGQGKRLTGASGGQYWTGDLGPETGPHNYKCPRNMVESRRARSFAGGEKVYCRPKIMAARPVAPAQAPAEKPTIISVNPDIQTRVSPQISPIFQQTGQGDQAAGTTMVSPTIIDDQRRLREQITRERREWERAENERRERYAREQRERQRERELERERERERDLQRRQERERELFEARQQAEKEQREATQQPVGAPPPASAPVNVPGAFIPPSQPDQPAALKKPAKAGFGPLPMAIALAAVGGFYLLNRGA